MEDVKLKELKKRLVLQKILASLFDNSLIEHLNRLEEQKIKEDPFISKQEVKEEPKPLKFLSQPSTERFKALKNKALAKEVEQTNGEVDASTERGE